jgi:hypothetical protein
MLSFKPQCVFIEGPDLSGKTTLIRSLHRETRYAYHLMDRSHISRNLFAKMYNRPTDPMMDLEINNLNNRYFILLPESDLVIERYNERGDEIHDLDGVLTVLDEFHSLQRTFIGDLPNVMFVPVERDRDLTAFIQSRLVQLSSCNMDVVAGEALGHAHARGGETWGLSFTIHEDGGFEQVVESDRDLEEEAVYYKGITDAFISKIKNEILGKNEYEKPQNEKSRRFVYASDTCISFIQLGFRDEKIDFSVCIRSSNLVKTLPSDLKFIHRLARDAQRGLLGVTFPTTFRISINSAHVVP